MILLYTRQGILSRGFSEKNEGKLSLIRGQAGKIWAQQFSIVKLVISGKRYIENCCRIFMRKICITIQKLKCRSP